MRRAIVHIGLPRTGTTSLQHVLADARPGLAAAGILYPALTPRAEATPHLSHQYLGEALDGRRPPAQRHELLQDLAAQLRASPASTVILSYEGLCRRRFWRRSPAPVLRDLFAAEGFTMETVLTVKPQTEYLNSLYTLRTQWLLEARPFADYAQRAMHTEGLDYAALLRPWHSARNGRVHLVPLRDRASDQPLAQRFFQQLGLWPDVAAPLAGAALDRRDNRSPGPLAVEAARRLRARGWRGPRDAARTRTRTLEQAADETVSFQGVTPDIAARINAAFAETNDQLAHAIWGVPWATRLDPNTPRPVNDIAGQMYDPTTERELSRLLAG